MLRINSFNHDARNAPPDAGIFHSKPSSRPKHQTLPKRNYDMGAKFSLGRRSVDSEEGEAERRRRGGGRVKIFYQPRQSA